VLEFRDGIKTSSQVKIQDEINLHYQGKKVINVS